MSGPPAAFSAESAAVPLTVGGNAAGQLGRTAANPALSFGPIDAPAMVAAVSGRDHNYAVDEAGAVWAWGENGMNQLGNGSTADRTTPVRLNLTEVRSIASGHYHGLAVKQDGSLWTWGYGSLGQLGHGTTASLSTPTRVSTLAGVELAAAGRDMSYATTTDGLAYGWGANSNGEVGDGTTTQRTRPVRISGLPEVTDIAGGRNHGLAVDTLGRVWAWGDNAYGQVGDGTTTDRPTPRIVLTGPAVHVAAGAHHSVALLQDGRVYTWGRGYRGQLGFGSTASRSTPTAVPNLTGVVSVGAGRDTTYAVTNEGRVRAWGDNSTGQVGDGTTTTRTSPVLLAVTGIAHAEGGSGHLMLLPIGASVENAAPVAGIAVPNCTDLECSMTSTSADSDGQIVATEWDFGDGSTGTGASVQHAYTAAGTFVVTLTVTDDDGATATATRSLSVTDVPPASPVGFRVTRAASGNATAAQLTVPTQVQAGDGMLLFVSTNTADPVRSVPSGWTQVGTVTDGTPDLRTTLLRKVATSGDSGSTIQVQLQTLSKYAISLAAYSGTDPVEPVRAWASGIQGSSGTAHPSPALAVPAPGGWVVSYWADKSSSTTAWVAPATQVQRATTIGSSSGRVTSLVVDSGAAVAAGAWPSLTASTNAAVSKVTMLTVVLAGGQ